MMLLEVASGTEDMTCYLYFIVIHVDVSGHRWLVAAYLECPSGLLGQ